jgi:periplasmic divalent cation tolerance protein
MEDRKDRDILTVTTTVGSVAEAQRLAQDLVARRLAACVQVEAGLHSVYRWDERVQQEPEVRLAIKTVPALEDALLAFFAEHHPYEVPQFLAHTERGSEAYARWVRAETSP